MNICVLQDRKDPVKEMEKRHKKERQAVISSWVGKGMFMLYLTSAFIAVEIKIKYVDKQFFLNFTLVL